MKSQDSSKEKNLDHSGWQWVQQQPEIWWECVPGRCMYLSKQQSCETGQPYENGSLLCSKCAMCFGVCSSWVAAAAAFSCCKGWHALGFRVFSSRCGNRCEEPAATRAVAEHTGDCLDKKKAPQRQAKASITAARGRTCSSGRHGWQQHMLGCGGHRVWCRG